MIKLSERDSINYHRDATIHVQCSLLLLLKICFSFRLVFTRRLLRHFNIYNTGAPQLFGRRVLHHVFNGRRLAVRAARRGSCQALSIIAGQVVGLLDNYRVGDRPLIRPDRLCVSNLMISCVLATCESASMGRDSECFSDQGTAHSVART